MTTQEIYKLANEMTEQEVLNVISGWKIESVNTYNSLVRLGDSMQLAYATVIAEKINRPWMLDGSEYEAYRIAYES